MSYAVHDLQIAVIGLFLCAMLGIFAIIGLYRRLHVAEKKLEERKP